MDAAWRLLRRSENGEICFASLRVRQEGFFCWWAMKEIRLSEVRRLAERWKWFCWALKETSHGPSWKKAGFLMWRFALSRPPTRSCEKLHPPDANKCCWKVLISLQHAGCTCTEKKAINILTLWTVQIKTAISYYFNSFTRVRKRSITAHVMIPVR